MLFFVGMSITLMRGASLSLVSDGVCYMCLCWVCLRPWVSDRGSVTPVGKLCASLFLSFPFPASLCVVRETVMGETRSKGSLCQIACVCACGVPRLQQRQRENNWQVCVPLSLNLPLLLCRAFTAAGRDELVFVSQHLLKTILCSSLSLELDRQSKDRRNNEGCATALL